MYFHVFSESGTEGTTEKQGVGKDRKETDSLPDGEHEGKHPCFLSVYRDDPLYTEYHLCMFVIMTFYTFYLN